MCTDAFLTITVFKVNEIKSLASGRKWPRSDKKIPAIRGFFTRKRTKLMKDSNFRANLQHYEVIYASVAKFKETFKKTK